MSSNSGGTHSRQVPQVRASASLAYRPSRLNAVRAHVSHYSYAGPDVSQVSAQGVHIPVVCSPPEYNQAGESTQTELINQLFVSFTKFNENVSIDHSTPISPSPLTSGQVIL